MSFAEIQKKMLKNGELLKEGMRRLEEAGVEEFRVDAELLFMDIFKCSRSMLFMDRNREVERLTVP